MFCMLDKGFKAQIGEDEKQLYKFVRSIETQVFMNMICWKKNLTYEFVWHSSMERASGSC